MNQEISLTLSCIIWIYWILINQLSAINQSIEACKHSEARMPALKADTI